MKQGLDMCSYLSIDTCLHGDSTGLPCRPPDKKNSIIQQDHQQLNPPMALPIPS